MWAVLGLAVEGIWVGARWVLVQERPTDLVLVVPTVVLAVSSVCKLARHCHWIIKPSDSQSRGTYTKMGLPIILGIVVIVSHGGSYPRAGTLNGRKQ